MIKTFKEYAKRARKTAVYNPKIFYPIIGIAGEAGEVAEEIKKWMRSGEELPSVETRVKVAKELGDLLWYIWALADDLGLTLETIATANINKLRKRKKENTLTGNYEKRGNGGDSERKENSESKR